MSSTEFMFRQGQPTAAYAIPYGYHHHHHPHATATSAVAASAGSWNTVMQPSWWNEHSVAVESGDTSLANTSTSTTSTASPPPPNDEQQKVLSHEELYANAHVYGMNNLYAQYPHQPSLQVKQTLTSQSCSSISSSNDDRVDSLNRFYFRVCPPFHLCRGKASKKNGDSAKSTQP